MTSVLRRVAGRTRWRHGLCRAAALGLGCLPLWASAQSATAPLPTQAPLVPAATKLEEAPLELNPFVVSAQKDVGYRATSSLAGTRINTDLRDLGAAISVVTKEFIEDSATTGIADLLVYTTGTEVGGAYGNFTNSTFDRGRPDQQTNRTNPEGNTRIRGLVSAELSRDFFITDFSSDSYNIERVDISRGPNSILFGVGSPGGVVNYSLKQPVFDRDRYEFSIRMGERNTHREVVDLNQIIVPKRVALRLSLLEGRENYVQEPAYEKNRRIYAAMDVVLHEGRSLDALFGTTKLRANAEYAEVSATPPSVIAPVDSIRDWYNVPDVAAIVAQTGQAAPARYTDGTFQSQALQDVFGANLPYRGSLAQLPPWFIAAGQIYNNPVNNNPPLVGLTKPGLTDLQAIEGRITGAGAFDWNLQSNLTEEVWTTGFTARTFQDTNIYDFEHQLITGLLEKRADKFNNVTATLEQLIQGGRGGIELSYNRQSFSRRSEFPFSDFRSTDVWLDNNLWLANKEPNPNVGRPLLISRDWGSRTLARTDRSTYRSTAFYKLDFGDVIKAGWGKWLGRHVLSGIVERTTRDSVTRNYAMATSSNEISMESALNGLKGNARRQLQAGFYVGPDLRGVKNYSDVRLSGYLDVTAPEDGDTFRVFVKDPTSNTIKNVTAFAEEYLNSGNARSRTIDSRALSLQSYLFNENIVGLLGYRRDRVRDTLNVGGVNLADGSFDPAALALNSTPSLDASGNTKTWSVVAHVPKQLPFRLPLGADISVFYAKSENFQPTGFRQDVFLRSIAPPTGETTEKGFNVAVLKDRFNVRVNWFETKNNNIALSTNLATSAIGSVTGWVNRLAEARRIGVPFGFTISGASTGLANYYSSYDTAIAALLNLVPEPMKTAANIRLEGVGVGLQNVVSNPVPGLASTSSFVAKGMEVEFVANPTRNWTIALNVAKQETIRSGSGLELQQYYNQIQQGLVAAHLWDTNIPDEPNVNGIITYKDRFTRDVLNPLATIRALDGTISQEQRKWRWNLMTAYKFSGHLLRGFEAGGTVRWQDKAAVGYPIILTTSAGTVLQTPDLARPFFAPATWNGDVFFRYRHALSKTVDWTIQLNLRNYLGDHKLTPEVINPDGKWAVVRIPVERTAFLTNTFSF